MLYVTHKRFAIFWALLGVMYLYYKGMTEINYYLALMLVVPFSKVGAVFPDLDHDWENVKFKNILTWVVNKLIHLTGGRHRSWQTHSIDIAVICTILSVYLPEKLYTLGKVSQVNREVLSIVMIGFSLGWLSHIFSDMLTTGKVKLLCFANWHVGFVPRRFLGLQFKTGGQWEWFVSSVTDKINVIITIVALAFPALLKYNVLGLILKIKG